jgi:hypothetical protein
MPDLRLVKLIVVGEVKSGDRARCRVCTVPLPPAQRLLFEADERRSLGVRSLDILIGMVERPGALVGGNHMPESVVVSSPSQLRY